MFELYTSRKFQLLCLQIGYIFIPTIQLEVNFSSHKLYHSVFIPWWHQRETRTSAILPPLLQGTLHLPQSSLQSQPLTSGFGEEKFLPKAMGRRECHGNMYCSFLYRNGRIFFVAVTRKRDSDIAEILDILFQDWK